MNRIGVYVCHCGLNIAGIVDVEKVVEYAESLPEVIMARHYTYTCSEPGQRMIQDDIKSSKLNRIVIATCSPKMHEETFRQTVAEAGLNPYLLEIVNLRENVSWVHGEEPEKATEKAKVLVTMGVERVRFLEPLERSRVSVEKSVLVVGGGIAGIQSSLDLAKAGLKVILIEKTPSLGGKMAMLDKTFPTLDCSACILTPKMTEAIRHPNIRLISYADVENVSGFVGNYEVDILKKPRYIDEDKCTGCGDCTKDCTVEMANEYELGLGKRKAIYRPFPQAAPNVFTIDKKGTPPCRAACSAGVNVQGYVSLIAQRKFKEAYDLIRQSIPFPSILGRVCFHPCESECERSEIDEPVAICSLKRFVIDYVMQHPLEKGSKIPVFKEKVAIIGSGPAGLTAAYELTMIGYPVTIFEALPEPGGMLRIGIPEFRLPKKILAKEVEYLKDMGIKIRTNMVLGKSLTFGELQKMGFKAVFLAIGAQNSPKLGIEGTQLDGVVEGINFLRDVNLGRKVEVGNQVAIIGGGNVAVDVSRVALRLGAKKVFIIYRRSKEEIPAFQPELEQAEREGVEVQFLEAPTRIIGDKGKVIGLECIRTKLGEPDKTGRRRPVPIVGSEYIIEVDMVIPAIGQVLDVDSLPEGVKSSRGIIKVDPISLQTSTPSIFAGGDAVLGASTVIDAVASGKEVAVSIHRYLHGEDLKAGRKEELLTIARKESTEDVEEKWRQVMPTLPIEERTKSFGEVELGFTEEMAVEEAKRCLACAGCSECLECEKACEADAIDHKQIPQKIHVKVGGIVIATGSELFDAVKIQEYGFGKSKNIISNLQFERLTNASGPTGGKIFCPETNKKPKSVAFIQCVGSRDFRFHENCCRIGCMATLKQAILAREKLGKNVGIYVYYNDMRAFGKGYDEFYGRARDMGVNFVAGLPSEIRIGTDGAIFFDAYEKGTNRLLELNPELVVLANGLVPNIDLDKFAALFHLSRSPDGFILEAHPKLRPLETAISGVFLAGTCQGPKDIPDTVAQASGAAAKAIDLLASGEIELEPVKAVIEEDLCSGCRFCESVCPFTAIEIEKDENKKLRAKVIEAMCQGCGLCASTCPTNAIRINHYTNDQVLAQIKVATLPPIKGGK